jgi:HK97 family phage major capsid protein
MKTLRQLNEERAQALADMASIVKKAEDEKRELNAEEFASWQLLDDKLAGKRNEKGDLVDPNEPGLIELIARRSKVNNRTEEAARKYVADNVEDPSGANPGDDLSRSTKLDLRNFSVRKMIVEMADARGSVHGLTGIEKEVHEEAVKEARALNIDVMGAGIPASVLAFKRDNSITQPTQPEDGSILVETEKRYEPDMMSMLRNQLVTRQLGATWLNDLTGNVSFTRMTQRAKATWKSEIATLDKSNFKFAADTMSPKRLGTFTIQSLQFLRQTSESVERLIREEIVYSIAEAVDEAAIFGTGASNQPMGILNHTGIAAINVPGIGTNGGPLTRGLLIALRTALLKRNIRPGGNVKWLMNAATEGSLSNIPVITGSDKFILDTEGRLLQYPYVMSNIVPSDLDKGTSVDVLSAIIFGAWKELFIGQWGGIDLTVDPYTLATEGQIRIIAQAFFDILVHRPEAFAYYKDVTTPLS